MPLLGPAALLLSFDIAPEAIAEHDDWHTHEHLPERLSIPGFLRGSRWVATEGGPRYLVLYEVATLATLTSPAYLERLNQPSPWTTRLMPHYRGMRRGLCSVQASHGLGLGQGLAVIRFVPPTVAADTLQRWLTGELLPSLPARRGLSSAHLLQGAAAAPMTNEQRIRGADAGVDTVLLISGYDAGALRTLSQALVGAGQLEHRGASAVSATLYRFDHALTRPEVSP